jgi:hypothetical protein
MSRLAITQEESNRIVAGKEWRSLLAFVSKEYVHLS